MQNCNFEPTVTGHALRILKTFFDNYVSNRKYAHISKYVSTHPQNRKSSNFQKTCCIRASATVMYLNKQNNLPAPACMRLNQSFQKKSSLPITQSYTAGWRRTLSTDLMQHVFPKKSHWTNGRVISIELLIGFHAAINTFKSLLFHHKH